MKKTSSQKKQNSFGILVAFSVLALLLSIALPQVSKEDPLLFRPELYHGGGKTHHFFEGWYHKLVHTSSCIGTEECDIESLSMAVVPGVFLDSGGNAKNESHAFIFVTINGEKQHYFRFDLETELEYDTGETSGNSGDHYVQIGNNRFSKHGMELNLKPRIYDGQLDDASVSIQGSVQYNNLSPWPIPSIYNLGAMGPVGYFLSPFLECYHDVLSFDHELEGTLVLNDDELNHTNTVVFGNSNEEETRVSSRGYVEKDRGSSFPSLWIWMQTNSFRKQPDNEGTSLFFSVARIPILTKQPQSPYQQESKSILAAILEFVRNLLPQLEFPGFTAALWLDTPEHPKQLIPFATWSGAYFEDLVVTEDTVTATIHSGGLASFPTLQQQQDSIDSWPLAMLLRTTRYAKAWMGSWFLPYDSRKFWYKLELEADRQVPHVMLYAPRTTTMEPFVNEALHATVAVRVYEYSMDESTGIANERLLLDDVGEHAGLEVHQNVQYLVDNVCGKPGASLLACL